MRLRTEMLDGELLAYDRIIDPYATGVVQVEYLKDDAMAAHALLQAIEAWGKHPGYQGGESWVKHRAAEILAGWLGEE